MVNLDYYIHPCPGTQNKQNTINKNYIFLNYNGEEGRKITLLFRVDN